MTTREPLLKPVPIAELRPTQITVGFREVQEKRKRWREHDPDKKAAFLGSHMIPVLLGPKKRHYVIDHHHLARALQEEGEENVLINVVADLHTLDKDAFWTVIDLVDDPFRSLAGELRRAGGFAKDTTPFSEFLWADFLRRRMKRKAVENDFSAALEEALGLAKSQDAGYLPGWCGPVDN
jgi:hypothetical protein